MSQFLVSPSSPGTLYRVGSDPEESAANWTSLDITTSSNDALCIEYIVVDDEVWVGSTWLDNPCEGNFSPCATSFTWYRVSNPPSGQPSGEPSQLVCTPYTHYRLYITANGGASYAVDGPGGNAPALSFSDNDGTVPAVGRPVEHALRRCVILHMDAQIVLFKVVPILYGQHIKRAAIFLLGYRINLPMSRCCLGIPFGQVVTQSFPSQGGNFKEGTMEWTGRHWILSQVKIQQGKVHRIL